MGSILVEGGIPLYGTIDISGAKNAVLPIMVTSLLTPSPLTLGNVPNLSDVNLMIAILKQHGIRVEQISKNKITLTGDQVHSFTAPHDWVQQMRASIWLLAPLLVRLGKAHIALPGGCVIGQRRIDMHIAVLEAFGAQIKLSHNAIDAISKYRFKGINFKFDIVSVGATITAILAAVLAQGTTILSNCAREPEIVDLCHCLNKMGAQISGMGTPNIYISGVDGLKSVYHKVMPDRIEAGTYMLVAAITGGVIRLNKVISNHLDQLTSKLQCAGVEIQKHDDSMIINGNSEIQALSVETNPYPAFATDLQAQLTSFLSVARGTSIIIENVFENRYMHVSELVKMGANISIHGRKAIVQGVKQLNPAEVTASDLRASMALVLAGLVTKGITKINNAYHIDRGYDSFLTKLLNCGAKIKRISV